MMSPEVSVIIPFTGKAIFMDEAVASVMQQSFQNFEVVLVENHATDLSREMATSWTRNYPGKIRLVFEKKKGAAAARNRGIQESRGKFLAFLDSDDRMKPNRLLRQWEWLSQDFESVLLGAWKDRLSPDGNQLVSRSEKPQVPKWASILFEEDKRFQADPLHEPQTSTFFLRKDYALEIGGFDEAFDPFWLEDTDFVFRMYQKGKIGIVPESLVEYRSHNEEEENKRIFDILNIRNHGIFFQKLKYRFQEIGMSGAQKALRRISSRWLRESATKIAYFEGGLPISKILLKRALWADKKDIRNIFYIMRFSLHSRFWPRPFGRSPENIKILPEEFNFEWAQTFLQI
ncbi:glycosyltransferase family 2 protein [Leptospirillum ferriphilum]|jgi:glycosyltransferase involved in cell wall biosynthesis|uniref:Glycosyl transferase n=2 Tax=Leptospirillum TaxID=179 RepID=A0A094WAC4_9BACT|nr:glycosyltransferase family A protein [Leptospirillum ferriphilum]KGA93475.1 glycosyl transferase [Leptospirillum ferriphilum]